METSGGIPSSEPVPQISSVASTGSSASRKKMNAEASASQIEKKCFVKIVAIGDSGVGKTCLIQQFEHSRFSENFKPTIGADFSNKEITLDGKIVTL